MLITAPRASLGLAFACAISGIVSPTAAHAQGAADLQVGKWMVAGADPTLYAAALWRDAWGPFGYSLRTLGLVDRDSLERSLYGLGPEITLLRGHRDRGGVSLYAVGGTGLALSSGESSGLSLLWSAGLGLALNARSLFSATLEARRLAEDRDFRGFWDLADGDRRGWSVALGFSLRWGPGSAGPGGPGSPGSGRPEIPVGGTGRSTGWMAEAWAATPTGLAGAIVETALAAMGEPYRWGGTSTEDGFDCSGLVWYAYAEHGVRIPRTSRDQARAGRAVAAEIAALEPGDILLFADRPGAVTHVGLYIGETRFIHATTSGGVRIGALGPAADANDRWYLSRWVGARRLLPESR